jgi:Major Facilitator Superfamily
MPRSAYLAVLGAAVLCYAALGAVLRVLPALVDDPAALGLLVGAPALTAVVTRPAGGRLADRAGAAPVLLAGAVVMAAGVVPALVWTGTPALLVSRLLVGAGEGAMLAAALLPLAGIALAARARRPRREPAAEGAGRVLPRVLLPGVALMLVNLGYVAFLAFGGATAGTALVVPVFAAGVIAVRTFGATVPDRLGGRRTLLLSTPLAAAGLLVVALGAGRGVALAGTALLAAGQGLAVPALGLLALARVLSPPAALALAAGGVAAAGLLASRAGARARRASAG